MMSDLNNSVLISNLEQLRTFENKLIFFRISRKNNSMFAEYAAAIFGSDWHPGILMKCVRITNSSPAFADPHDLQWHRCCVQIISATTFPDAQSSIVWFSLPTIELQAYPDGET